MIVYADINYHLHASYYSIEAKHTFCSEAVTVPAGSDTVDVRFVMDRPEGGNSWSSNGVSYPACSIEVVDDPKARPDQ